MNRSRFDFEQDQLDISLALRRMNQRTNRWLTSFQQNSVDYSKIREALTNLGNGFPLAKNSKILTCKNYLSKSYSQYPDTLKFCSNLISNQKQLRQQTVIQLIKIYDQTRGKDMNNVKERNCSKIRGLFLSGRCDNEMSCYQSHMQPDQWKQYLGTCKSDKDPIVKVKFIKH